MNQFHRSFRQEMDVFDCRYYKINKFFLSCHGQWVFQTGRQKLLGRSFIFFCLITTLYLQFRFLFAVWGNDIDATLECLPPLTLILMCFCQLSIYSCSQKKNAMLVTLPSLHNSIQYYNIVLGTILIVMITEILDILTRIIVLLLLINNIKNDWKLWSTGMELAILRNYAESGRNYTILYAAYVSMTVFTFVTASVTPIILDILIPLNETRPKQLVYAVLFPFDHDKYFHWILIHGGVTAFINLTTLVSAESMLAVTTQHACGLFAITSYRLQNILEITNARILGINKSKQDILYEEISFSIRYHNYAIRFSNILESLYSPLIFFTVGGNVITTSVVLMQTLNSLGTIADTIKFGAFALAIIFHIYVLSLPAQSLLDHSSEVANKALQESWYEMPEKSKRLLTMIALQTYRPCKLTVGKICVFNMVTFAKILKTSLSYFTVLSSVR